MRESNEPSREEKSKKLPRVSWKRDIPLRYEADVAVLGGGIAGVCAACAAAASGASVILVERFAIAGGVLATGGVANFSGDTRGIGEVFDLGYTPHEGERRGRRGAITTTYRDGLNRVFGIHRRARKKIFPWILVVFAILPAVVFVGFAFLLGLAGFLLV